MIYRDAAMFVTFEGLDGSGKTTQVELLAQRLGAEGRDVVRTREPGGTELGEAIRQLVLHGGHVAPWAEAALYAASRAQHVEEVIRPALERGAVVLCDRYVDSSVAYQGVGRDLGLERVLELNLAAVGGLMPERTFLLDLDPGEVAARLRGVHDRLERAGGAFYERVAGAYRELADRFPDRIVVVDATLPPDDIARTIAASLGVRAS
jgi:dTMP kinase